MDSHWNYLRNQASLSGGVAAMPRRDPVRPVRSVAKERTHGGTHFCARIVLARGSSSEPADTRACARARATGVNRVGRHACGGNWARVASPLMSYYEDRRESGVPTKILRAWTHIWRRTTRPRASGANRRKSRRGFAFSWARVSVDLGARVRRWSSHVSFCSFLSNFSADHRFVRIIQIGLKCNAPFRDAFLSLLDKSRWRRVHRRCIVG